MLSRSTCFGMIKGAKRGLDELADSIYCLLWFWKQWSESLPDVTPLRPYFETNFYTSASSFCRQTGAVIKKCCRATVRPFHPFLIWYCCQMHRARNELPQFLTGVPIHWAAINTRILGSQSPLSPDRNYAGSWLQWGHRGSLANWRE